MKILALLLFLMLAKYLPIAQSEENSLKLISLIFRHGARSPLQTIPDDPNNKYWNNFGHGQLINLGKWQQFRSGEMTKQRYLEFLGSTFNDSQLFLQSTSVPRAIMSGQCFVAGMYPPTGDEDWSDDGTIGKVWQPIPIYTTLDRKGMSTHTFVKSFDNSLIKSFLTSSDWDTIKLIANGTGIPLSDFQSISYAVDALICEIYKRMDLSFGLENLTEEIKSVSNNLFNGIIVQIYKSLAYHILNDIVARIDFFNNGSSSVKTNLYAAHDTYVASIMTALTNETFGEPSFSSTIYLELYEHIDNKSSDYITLWYRPSINSNTTSYFITDCGFKCPFEQFKNLVTQLNNA